MALFQEAIVKKHLNDLDAQVLDDAYNEYLKVYSTEKIKNIRIAKEEQYQEGFIKDIFGSVLGYSVYPESPYNIETEKKNESNAKKADGAILKDEKVVGVIELKDNKTKNLDAVKDQAFGYKNNHKECSYVISSNFHKLRFYIDDATEYEEFDLYNLDKDTFKRFYLYLRKEGLLDKNLPKLLRQETKFHEEEISKKLYKDYSNFKRSFFENAAKNNLKFDKLELFKKSQKFLDRILFLLFAEDKGLVGTNSIVNIVEKWSNADDDYYQPLYEMVTKFFGHLYNGFIYQKTGEEIPQFGGELFAPDEVLDQLRIDDEVLKNDLLVLSKYDFNTDVDVNILGHIFEHSLNEVDDVEAELRGEQLDKTKSKRKKDGVFYTPKYITKYIVDNTLGKLCSEKKAELKLDQDLAIHEYQKADGKLNEKGKVLFKELNNYKSWLLTVKVCDPACGSGAFLNQALSYFIEEHKQIDDIIAELTNTPMRLFDTDLQILENNIFGVDINEESVEIAKLSMWLRTAQPGRKLSDLSNNIKCGNSLIDDPEVAGDKAFKWQKEFPTVFIEKNKFAFHITTCLHDSRTSSRMVEYKVRERRFDGIKPNAEVNPLTKEEEELIATIVSEIAKEDNLNIAAFNLCKDHMHILLICEEEEISSIMQKIKAKTARAVNIHRGSTKILAPHNKGAKLGEASPNKGACSLDETHGETSPNKGACSLDEKENACSLDETQGEASPNKGAGSLDEKENACFLDDRNTLHSLDSPRGEKQNSLWTQKFGCKPISSDEQFRNTVHYIENNKEKHNLPRNPKLETIIGGFVKSYEDCLKTEHTGGFDVVIGNPPYGVNFNEVEKKYLSNFDKSVPDYEIYIYFISLYRKILKNQFCSFLSYIFPNTFLSTVFGKKYRDELLSSISVYQIVDLSNDNTFVDASVRTCIFSFRNNKDGFDAYFIKPNNESFELFRKYTKSDLLQNSKNLMSLFNQTNNEIEIINKIKVNNILSKFHEVSQGLIPYDKYRGHDEQTIKNRIWHSTYQKDETFKKELKGGDVNRFNIKWNGELWISYGEWLAAPRKPEFFRNERILVREILADKLYCGYTNEEYYNTPSCINIIDLKQILDLRFTICVLNSKLIGWYCKKVSPKANKGLFPKILVNDVRNIPLIEIDKNAQNIFVEKAGVMLQLNKALHEQTQKFQSLLNSDFKIEKPSKKIEEFYLLEWSDFNKELQKIKITLLGVQKDDWFDRFERFKKQALELKSQIDQTDAAIDRMVYELYGLTEDEIQIVENS